MFDRHMKSWPEGVPHTIEVPECTLTENLRRTAAEVPDSAAVIYYGATLTYRELEDQVDCLAGWLDRTAGIRRGDRVLLYMQNSPQFIISYYAILRANAVVVPVNPMNRTAELRHLLADTGARAALAGQELLGQIAPLISSSGLAHIVAAAYADMSDPEFDHKLPSPLDKTSPQTYGEDGVTSWRDALAAGLRPGPLTAGMDDLAVIPYSSGTTGRPKGCMHSHRTVMTTVVAGEVWNPIPPRTASLVTLPLFHVTGMQTGMNGPIRAGDTIVLMTRWDRRVAADLIARYQVTRWRNISTMAIDLVNDPDIGRYDLTSLRFIGGGGAAMPAGIARRLKELTGLDYIEGYGMSETMAAVMINPVGNPRRQCLGIPIFDVDARVIDPQSGRELGPGEPGEIVINAPQNFLGYWNNPDATRSAFMEIGGQRFLRTGDIAQFDEDGYFTMVDRLKRMISVSGFKVWPTEVEAMMHDHPDIGEVCVVGRPDPRQGEAVLAYVVPRAAVEEGALIGWCKAQMAAYKCPSEIRLVDELPRSPTGKVRWKDLQEEVCRETAG